MYPSSTRILATLTLSVLAAPAYSLTFEEWRSVNFDPLQLADTAISGALSDPDADGQANFAEYFLGGDPLLADTTFTAPKVGLVNDTLTLSFPESNGQASAVPFLQSSGDLIRWITYNTLPEVDRESLAGHDLVTVADPVPLNEARRFLRLKLLAAPVDATLLAPTLPAIELESPTHWRIRWSDPNIAETHHAIEHLRISTGQWHRLAYLSGDLNQWLNTAANFADSLTYRVVAQSADGAEMASEPVSLPDTDGDGIPDALEAGSPYAAIGAFASYFDQFDSDGDGMSDGWEARNGFDPLDPADGDPAADFDGDGISNKAEYLAGTDPKDYYNGQPAVLTFVSGHQQTPTAGEYYAAPVVVRVTRPNGTVLVNAPLVFNVTGDAPGGGLAATGGSSEPVQTKTVRTNASGLAQIYWKVVAP